MTEELQISRIGRDAEEKMDQSVYYRDDHYLFSPVRSGVDSDFSPDLRLLSWTGIMHLVWWIISKDRLVRSRRAWLNQTVLPQ